MYAQRDLYARVQLRVSTKSALVEFIAVVKSLVPVNPHQSGDSRAMLATANSGKTFHSEIRLIQPWGATARKVFPAFPFFKIRREAIQSGEKRRGEGEGGGVLNCKFDPDRSCALATPASIRSYRTTSNQSHVQIHDLSLLSCFLALCRLAKLIGERGASLIYGLKKVRREKGKRREIIYNSIK